MTTRPSRDSTPPRRQHGQALAEYVVATGVLALALFAPWGGQPAVATRLLEIVARTFRHHALALALS